MPQLTRGQFAASNSEVLTQEFLTLLANHKAALGIHLLMFIIYLTLMAAIMAVVAKKSAKTE